MFQPRAADLAMADVETALVHGAVGDYGDEAAVLLLSNFGHWLPQLQSADLITLAPDLDGDGLWAQIVWPDVERALSTGLILGSSGEVRVLRAAASNAEGHPVDLGDLAAGLNRRALTCCWRRSHTPPAVTTIESSRMTRMEFRALVLRAAAGPSGTEPTPGPGDVRCGTRFIVVRRLATTDDAASHPDHRAACLGRRKPLRVPSGSAFGRPVPRPAAAGPRAG